MAHGGAAVACIDFRVEYTIKRHGGGARGNHGHDNPTKATRQTIDMEAAIEPGKQCAGQGKGQRKNGMLEFNHFERQTQAFPKAVHSRVAVTILGDRADADFGVI